MIIGKPTRFKITFII